MEEKKLSSDAYQWAYDRYIKGDPEMEKYFEELGVKADIAHTGDGGADVAAVTGRVAAVQHLQDVIGPIVVTD